MSIVITCYLNSAILYLYYIYQMFIINKVENSMFLRSQLD